MGLWTKFFTTVIKTIFGTCGKGDHQQGFRPMSYNGVRLWIQDHHVLLDNGIVQVTLSKPGGLVTGVRYNGLDNVLEVLNQEGNRGYWDVVWSALDDSGRKGVFEVISATSYKVIVETEEQVELSFSRPWDPCLRGKLAPINIDKRFVLLRGSSGFYTYAIYEHLGSAEWQGFSLGETRIAFKLRKDRFHYMAVADDRRRYMPLPDDRLAGRAQPLAFQEAVSLVNPVVPEFRGEVDDKYQYTCENKDLMVHGWISNDPPVGFWQIIPSNEFRTGGPLKQNLCSHVGPTCLAVFVGAHYAGDDLVPKFAQGEPWKKVFGPVFIYLNSTMCGEDPITLWDDAKRQMMVEVSSWPYSFPASEDFPKSHDRGNCRGRLLVRDRYLYNDDILANGAYIGLAPRGDVGSWQRECKDYQFWTEANCSGEFSIKNVRCGEYNLYAWVPGFLGDYQFHAPLTIIPGCDINLGDLIYEPPRDGPTLWEIGIPDRSAAEFHVPEPNPNYVNQLFVNNPKRRKEDNSYEGTTWQIKFRLENVRYAAIYKLRIALAGAALAEVQIRVNDPNKPRPLFTTGLIGRDNAIARHGIHGLYWLYNIDISGTLLIEGENTIYLKQPRNQSPFQGIMYDYIRLEGPPN
uniref:probable rhamnogalacturonate lyase B isoform X2 n=1 Tax=Erigeron canadensis TaxID=72917 RepID=UPI001CB9CD88|nr:probable rhamnogalacturonate lyase B isoform X2 [Erigeron canadensis]